MIDTKYLELIPYLSENSRTKLTQIKLRSNFTLDSFLNCFAKKMISAAIIKIKLKSLKKIKLTNLRNILIDFNRNFNYPGNTKFEKDVMRMECVTSIGLEINQNLIEIHFLSHDKEINQIGAIVQALHIFCHTISYQYDGLTIYICLDDNKRDLDFPTTLHYPEIFDYLHQASTAFNVSGVTNRYQKRIILTKKEELIKLMYHEMIHYVGIDNLLLGHINDCGWAITNTNLNLSEAYTEFLSIILISIYQSIHLSHFIDQDFLETYELILKLELNYSWYLTAKIIQFYGYDRYNFRDFFKGLGEKKNCPILIWEYVILRTQLFNNIDQLLKLINTSSWYITENNKNDVINLLKIDEKFLDILFIFISNINSNHNPNISYTLIDLNWN